ncbi:MAG: thioredoxin domain-containing protein [Acidobacteriota bacterium]
MSNRLADEISPYLLMHADNPVDWMPWGPEAIERARREDKPIFLSVGYATCYWCHVMERESFADAGTAALMNERFINIKVDREERPELDEIYMAATQIFTQQGGWPNSVFLTPALAPYFAGTYFPPVDQHGRPSFKTVLLSMDLAWRTRRDEVEQQASDLADAMRRMLEERGAPSDHVAAADAAERAKRSLMARFDAEHGGFGAAPKFPTPSNLLLLLDLAPEDARAAEMLEGTLDAMARGGIYDQLAGGFHRYATDRAWLVPHFEKMLYDNGLLLEVYALDYARTGSPERARILRETARFLSREMTDSAGAFHSAIDAEVGGREGAYHAWTAEQLVAALGSEDAGFLAGLYGFDDVPFFDGDHYVLHHPRSFEELAAARRLDPSELRAQVEPLRAKLLAAREEREQPRVDDKVLADWNGLAIAGLARAGDLLEAPELVDQARAAARFVLDQLVDDDGLLHHSWRAGTRRFAAYLSDYVSVVHGLLALHDAEAATETSEWLDVAIRLAQQMCDRLEDPKMGGFFTAEAADDVLFRSKEIYDGALPAANGMAADVLLRLAEADPARSDTWFAAAERTLRAFTRVVESQPEGAKMLALVSRRWHRASEARAQTPFENVEGGLRVHRLVADAARGVVTPTLHLDPLEDGAVPTAGRTFRLELAIRDGWHLDAPPSGDAPQPDAPQPALSGADEARVEALRIVGEPKLVSLEWPVPEELPAADGGTPRPIYRGTVEIRGRFAAGDGAPRLLLRFQPCDDLRCLPPVELDVVAATSGD